MSKIDLFTRPLNTAAAENGYKFITTAQRSILSPTDRQTAIGGLRFVTPDHLPEGHNSICFQDPMQEGNGLLNLHGRYGADGNTTTRTFMISA